jgi:8-oxo-dGTP diphosphatase
MKSPYLPPTLTVDGVVFQIIGSELMVLLVKRRNEPFRGHYALPGGYNAQGETTTEALGRVLKKKAGIDTKAAGRIEQLYTFDSVGRDPRGHAVSVVYMILGRNMEPEQSETTESPCFMPIGNLPKLSYDHKDIIRYARDRLRSKIGYTNAIFALLPRHFTLSQLQAAYEAVLGKSLDKRNFRKQFLALSVLSDTATFHQDGAHRPAKLYKFKNQKLHNFVSNLT